MKFREYGEVVPLTVTASTPRGLDMAIESIGQKRDVIDLQFSTTTKGDSDVEYSALLLVRSH